MTMHEFWASFPAWEVIVLIVYSIVLTVYFFATMIIAVDDDDIPLFLFSKEGYDILACPFWICVIIWELFMMPAQLLLLCIYAVVQWMWSVKERPKKEKKVKAKKQ
jgi:hypothetical protein